jgi:hypothetical protein
MLVRLLPRRVYRTMSTKSVLSTFLSSQKSLYLQDIQNGKGKEWTVVMGNEAGGESIARVHICVGIVLMDCQTSTL